MTSSLGMGKGIQNFLHHFVFSLKKYTKNLTWRKPHVIYEQPLKGKETFKKIMLWNTYSKNIN